MKACEDSLRRLGTDWIDLYQIHRPDPSTDIDETLGAFSDLVHQGKIRAFGSSTFPADEIVEAQWMAERRGRERFQCEQPPYSIFTRGIERDVLPTVQRYGMGCIVWSPLSAGWLTRPLPQGDRRRHDAGPGPAPARRASTRRCRATSASSTSSRSWCRWPTRPGVTMAHLAIAFTLEHPGVTSAIIGPRTMDQLETLLGADEVRLDADVLDRIDELVPPGTNLNAGRRRLGAARAAQGLAAPPRATARPELTLRRRPRGAADRSHHPALGQRARVGPGPRRSRRSRRR